MRKCKRQRESETEEQEERKLEPFEHMELFLAAQASQEEDTESDCMWFNHSRIHQLVVALSRQFVHQEAKDSDESPLVYASMRYLSWLASVFARRCLGVIRNAPATIAGSGGLNDMAMGRVQNAIEPLLRQTLTCSALTIPPPLLARTREPLVERRSLTLCALDAMSFFLPYYEAADDERWDYEHPGANVFVPEREPEPSPLQQKKQEKEEEDETLQQDMQRQRAYNLHSYSLAKLCRRFQFPAVRRTRTHSLGAFHGPALHHALCVVADMVDELVAAVVFRILSTVRRPATETQGFTHGELVRMFRGHEEIKEWLTRHALPRPDAPAILNVFRFKQCFLDVTRLQLRAPLYWWHRPKLVRQALQAFLSGALDRPPPSPPPPPPKPSSSHGDQHTHTQRHTHVHKHDSDVLDVLDHDHDNECDHDDMVAEEEEVEEEVKEEESPTYAPCFVRPVLFIGKCVNPNYGVRGVDKFDYWLDVDLIDAQQREVGVRIRFNAGCTTSSRIETIVYAWDKHSGHRVFSWVEQSDDAEAEDDEEAEAEDVAEAEDDHGNAKEIELSVARDLCARFRFAVQADADADADPGVDAAHTDEEERRAHCQMAAGHLFGLCVTATDDQHVERAGDDWFCALCPLSLRRSFQIAALMHVGCPLPKPLLELVACYVPAEVPRYDPTTKSFHSWSLVPLLRKNVQNTATFHFTN